MTDRRALGAGPQAAHTIRAAQADLLTDLPGVRLPDLDELRGRGMFAPPRTGASAARRPLGDGGSATSQP
ncbi:hypothetical protein AB0G32_14085 [Streptomyces sp. NPDC023723]|uniref:hypothetical protein n=1 Tax=Streptomyces sp. NPDC023723 TaxID=3154323 RepID=UPI0033ECC026